MEQWEIDTRKKLNAEMKDGMYRINGGSMIVHTGKGGVIEALIALEKESRNVNLDELKEELDTQKAKPPLIDVTEAEIKAAVEEAFKDMLLFVEGPFKYS